MGTFDSVLDRRFERKQHGCGAAGDGADRRGWGQTAGGRVTTKAGKESIQEKESAWIWKSCIICAAHVDGSGVYAGYQHGDAEICAVCKEEEDTASRADERRPARTRRQEKRKREGKRRPGRRRSPEGEAERPTGRARALARTGKRAAGPERRARPAPWTRWASARCGRRAAALGLAVSGAPGRQPRAPRPFVRVSGRCSAGSTVQHAVSRLEQRVHGRRRDMANRTRRAGRRLLAERGADCEQEHRRMRLDRKTSEKHRSTLRQQHLYQISACVPGRACGLARLRGAFMRGGRAGDALAGCQEVGNTSRRDHAVILSGKSTAQGAWAATWDSTPLLELAGCSSLPFIVVMSCPGFLDKPAADAMLGPK